MDWAFIRATKFILRLIVLCLLPIWAFLPVALAGALINYLGIFIGLIVSLAFGYFFYTHVFMLVFDFMNLEFWDD